MPEIPQRNWYAIKVFFNKVFEMEALLDGIKDTETFLPVDKVQLKGLEHLRAKKRIAEKKDGGHFIQEGPFIYERVPLVTSLIFVHTPAERIPEIEERLTAEDPLSKRGFIYKKADKQSYAVIPEWQMTSFRLVVSQGREGLGFFSADDLSRFKEGHRVRVKEGPLKGAEGYIKRIRRDRRLLVGIDGVVAVATAHIPPECLEIVAE